MKQYATLESTMYFWFAANDTSGSGGDGATPLVDVRLAGAAVDAIPVLSPTPILLTHANYPAGCYEVAIAATAANGFAINNTYAVFCTLAIDSQNPTGFIGSFDLKPVLANAEDSVCDALLTGSSHNIATSLGRRIREIGAFAIESGTAQTGTSNSITLAAIANGTDGVYNRNLIVLTDNTGKGQTRTVVDYDGATKKVVVDRDWRVTPDNTTTYQIVPDDTPLTVDHGVARGGTSTTITIREYASSVNDAYLCNIVTIIAGKGRGQARLVSSYNGTTKVVTICGDDWVEIPDTTSIYVMMPYGTTCTACLTDSALASVKTAIEVDGSKIDHLWEMTEDDDGIRRLTENALEQADTGAIASVVNEINQSLNGAKVVIDRAANTFKVYDTDGETLLFTITKATVGNVDTLTRT